MKTVLVTGPIGSGKSEVCRYLASLGWPVYDCDSRTKGLYASVPGLKRRVEEAVETDWEHIGVIFSDARKRERLEAVVYPYVVEDIMQWKAENSASALLFIESAIAMDKRQFDGLYDAALLVRADRAERIRRNPKAAERDGLQSFEPDRMDYIIDNDADIEELHNKTDIFLKQI